MGYFFRLCVVSGVLALCAAQTAWSFQLSVFDVGQGEALWVRWGKECVWIDFGTKFAANVRTNLFLLEHKKCGSSWFMVSHRDWDHSGGLFSLHSILGITRVVMPLEMGAQPGKVWKENRFSELKVALRHSLPEALVSKIDWLWPIPGQAIQNENDTSLVLRIWDNERNHCAILTGDITQRVETQLIRSSLWIRCDVLKIAHHGSRTSTSENFLRAVDPRIALISSGWKNRYGHPHGEVLQRLKASHTWVFRTDWMGRIDLDVKEAEVDVATVRGNIRIAL